jgi:hypothetical protein
LTGRVGDFAVCGPRAAVWDVGDRPHTFAVQGTAVQFVSIRPTYAGAHRIRIAADPEARLQVTLLRLTDNWPSMEVVASWSASARRDASASSSPGRLSLAVRSIDGKTLQIQSIAVEQNEAEFKRCEIFEGQTLASATMSAECANEATFDLPLSTIRPADANAIVKVLARDEHGRSIAGWAILERSLHDIVQVAEARDSGDL